MSAKNAIVADDATHASAAAATAEAVYQPSMADQLRSGKAENEFALRWADLEWDPRILALPRINPNSIMRLEFDETWGSMRDLYRSNISLWEIQEEGTIRMGSLTAPVFTPSDMKFTEIQVGAANYVGGYLASLSPEWRSDVLRLDDKPAAYRNGFADGVAVVLRKAALLLHVATAAELDVLLRQPRIGENSELKPRLEKIMSAPSNAPHFVRYVEACMTALAKRANVDTVNAALSKFSSNRRALIIREMPVQTREKKTVVKDGKGKTRTIPEKYKVSVMPTLSKSHQGLMSHEEQATAARWNEFARVETWPIGNRTDWQTEVARAKACANTMSSAASKMRRLLRERKQSAYNSLPSDLKKDAKKLAEAIEKLVASLEGDALACIIRAHVGREHLDRNAFWSQSLMLPERRSDPTEVESDTDEAEAPPGPRN